MENKPPAATTATGTNAGNGKGEKMKKLMEQMIGDLRAAARDDYGPHKPTFYPSENASAGENYSVTVQYSRDPSRSNNGGEYYLDRRYFIVNGSVHSYLVSSYEDSEAEEWTDHGVAGTLETIERMLTLSVRRVEAELTPAALDFVKIRRRVEDALRKTATNDDLVAVAGLLGVKTE